MIEKMKSILIEAVSAVLFSNAVIGVLVYIDRRILGNPPGFVFHGEEDDCT